MRTYIYTPETLQAMVPEDWSVTIGEGEIRLFETCVAFQLDRGAEVRVIDDDALRLYAAPSPTDEDREQDQDALNDSIGEWLEEIRLRVVAG